MEHLDEIADRLELLADEIMHVIVALQNARKRAEVVFEATKQ